MLNELLSHLWPWTEFLKEAIENKDYDGALYMITDIKEKWKLSKEQLNFLDKLKDNIIRLKDLI